MNIKTQNTILKSTNATSILETEHIQTLWSGYGEITRLTLAGSKTRTIIVKHVKLHKNEKHPRGWNSQNSHDRKLKSYQVESNWYKSYSLTCSNACKVPSCFAIHNLDDELIIIMEDLDASGYSQRKTDTSWSDIEVCLGWLAHFHASFMHHDTSGLWKRGTYWHLATRPDELKSLTDVKLKAAAHKIDATLNQARFKTIVHGDAKLANFCFSDEGSSVAAVDFQYVGGGCGMKDVAYFIGSCLSEEECESYEADILNCYFSMLQNALALENRSIDASALENEWRSLYHFAWADFHRFLKGWSPGHWKIHSYSERVTRKVIDSL